jgi:uncharacterized protein YktB (UPF0637 family)
MAIDRFTRDDFALFEIPGFATRMPLLRANIKPKLAQIGDALQAPLSALVGETLNPHVAQHLRRTVNPPEETWVAFSKERRAYKPYVHYRVAINAENVRVTVFVEDYAEEKEAFAQGLESHSDALAAHFILQKKILAYHIFDAKGVPLRGEALTAETLRAFAARMHRLKGQHAVFGVPLPAPKVLAMSEEAFLKAVLKAAKTLLPLYHCKKRMVC